MQQKDSAIELAAQIASAFVSNNSIRSVELPRLFDEIHGALRRLSTSEPAAREADRRTPAVPIRKSVDDNFIVCLEDGRKFKSLKRHLWIAYNLTPDQYRAKWGLPADYPMVAPTYSRARADIAKESGFGRGRRRPRR